VLIVRDRREQPAQLDRRGKFAVTIECGADRSSFLPDNSRSGEIRL